MQIKVLLVAMVCGFADALKWSDLCVKATKTCYFHPLNEPPFNSINQYVNAQVMQQQWTLLLNPYSQMCEVGNCTTVPLPDPSYTKYGYNFGHIVIPYSGVTIASIHATVPVVIEVDDVFYTNNIRSEPECGVMTFAGRNVHAYNLHFIYSGECANESAVDDRSRVPVRMVNSATGTASFDNVTCKNCFAPVGLVPGDLNGVAVVRTIDTTGTTIDRLSSTAQTYLGYPIALLCPECIGAITINTDAGQRIWWSSGTVPDGTYKLFNVSQIYSAPAVVACGATLSSSGGVSESAVHTLIILLVVFIAVTVAFALAMLGVQVHKMHKKRPVAKPKKQ